MLSKALFSSNRMDWTTPQDFFDELNKEFHFTLDPCALPETAKCKVFFTPEDDGLKQSWGGACGFLQPSLWQGHRQVGKEMLRREQERRRRGPADSCKDGHQILPRIYLSQVHRNEIYTGQAEIWRFEAVCPFSFNASNIQ